MNKMVQNDKNNILKKLFLCDKHVFQPFFSWIRIGIQLSLLVLLAKMKLSPTRFELMTEISLLAEIAFFNGQTPVPKIETLQNSQASWAEIPGS